MILFTFFFSYKHHTLTQSLPGALLQGLGKLTGKEDNFLPTQFNRLVERFFLTEKLSSKIGLPACDNELPSCW